MRYVQVISILAHFIFGAACNGPAQTNLPKGDESASGKKEADHPKLFKTIGSPRYGNVQCMVQDRAGNLWYGTTENGLYKFDGKAFSRYLMADGLNSNSIHSILQDKNGIIWIGTEAGLCFYDGKTFSEVQLPLPKNHTPSENRNNRKLHWVYSIMQAKSGALWFLTINGAYVYDGASPPEGQEGFRLFPLDDAPNGYMSSYDKAERMLEDKDGNIWFGGRTNEGVYRYDGKSVINIKPEVLFQDGPKPKPHNWGWPQLQDRNGNIWFSNWGGAYRYDGKSFTSFSKEDGLPGEVTRIIEDQKGNIWFGGANGLSRYDGKSFTRFGIADGLVNPWVWSMMEDKAGNIWVGTRETGLYLFDGKAFVSYSEYRP